MDLIMIILNLLLSLLLLDLIMISSLWMLGTIVILWAFDVSLLLLLLLLNLVVIDSLLMMGNVVLVVMVVLGLYIQIVVGTGEGSMGGFLAMSMFLHLFILNA